jgi:hypothetical protein
MPVQTRRKKNAKPAQRRLSITVDEVLYDRLQAVVGKQNISRLFRTLVRPIVTKKNLDDEYRLMAADKLRESEAREWCDALIGDMSDETR